MTTGNDLARLSTIVTNEYVRKYLFDNEVLDTHQIHDILLRSIESFKNNGYGLWLLEDALSQTTMGIVGLWEFFDEAQPQLLYALLPDFIGKGIAAEASRAIVRYSFDRLGFNYVSASCDTHNESSHKVAKRLGMVKTKEATINGKPTTFYSIENKSQ
jgi:ribosomal-protein-alanine N-acetyltransferase